MGRHRSDAQVNSSPVTVLREHEEVASQWKHLQPGDLVKVCHAIPQCRMVLLLDMDKPSSLSSLKVVVLLVSMVLSLHITVV